MTAEDDLPAAKKSTARKSAGAKTVAKTAAGRAATARSRCCSGCGQEARCQKDHPRWSLPGGPCQEDRWPQVGVLVAAPTGPARRLRSRSLPARPTSPRSRLANPITRKPAAKTSAARPALAKAPARRPPPGSPATGCDAHDRRQVNGHGSPGRRPSQPSSQRPRRPRAKRAEVWLVAVGQRQPAWAGTRPTTTLPSDFRPSCGSV